MKKTLLGLLLSLFSIAGLYSQTEIFKVQGIPRPDLGFPKNVISSGNMQLVDAITGDPYDYSTFTFDSIKYWVGEGSNRAALIIDWHDEKGSPSAMVWGFQWAKDSIRTGFDMVLAIAKADPKFLLLTHHTGPMGNTVAGLGYDINSSGKRSLIFEGDTKNPHYPVNGVVTTTAYNYDDWTSSDAHDYWASGWFSAYFSYQIMEQGDNEFSYSGLGASSRILENGSCDAWSFASFDGSMGGSLPRMPFVGALPFKIKSFPNYESDWSEMGKDSTHLSIIHAKTARKMEQFSEKWSVKVESSSWFGGQPIIVNDNIYIAVGEKISIIDKNSGKIIKEAKLAGNCGVFSMIAYGEGKVFVPMDNGVLQALHAETLESIWVTEKKIGFQQISPIVYHKGYVYTGMWDGKSPVGGSYYCVSAEDQDVVASDEIKTMKWESNSVGFYWAGGTIVGDVIVFGGEDGVLQSRNRISGELMDTLIVAPHLTKSTLRSGISYDKTTNMLYFTAKEANQIMGIQLETNGSFKKSTFVKGEIANQLTTVPIVYNGRVYVSSGTMTSKGGLDVMDAVTLEKIYTVDIGGVSQSTPLITTAYATEANHHTVYIYLTLNNNKGTIVCLKDFEGNKEPIIEFNYNPSQAQYCTHSLIADKQGVIYYKNDSKYLLALKSTPTNDVEYVTMKDTIYHLFAGESKELIAKIFPSNASNKKMKWMSTDTSVATVNSLGLVSALKLGATKIVVITEDGSFSDTCFIRVKLTDYTQGVFFVNEDWFGHDNGSVNFLDHEGFWHYRIYQKENPGKELGVTTQYGSIYGDKMYIVSKQGVRFTVCDATTMKSLAEFPTIGNADGRSFTGVNEHKGYLSTSNGIYIFDIDSLKIRSQVKGTENATGGLYTGQVGTMIVASGKVFAVHQQKGLLVIDVETDSVISTIGAPLDGSKQRGYGSIVQSKDGNLWLSVASNVSGNGNAEEYMIRLNPNTLDTSRILLPVGASIPNSWYAWTADGFCASTQQNKIYWKNNGGWFNASKIYEYDIDQNTTKLIMDLATYEPSQAWGIYGAGFRIDPITDDVYISLYQSFGSSVYKVIKFNANSGLVSNSYSMDDHYWFPAMPVFPDNHAPIVTENLTNIQIVQDTAIYLGDKVSDIDNYDFAIVKSIIANSNDSILIAEIRHDSLIISPIADQVGVSEIEIKFNSNGKICTKTIRIELIAKVVDVISIELNKSTLNLKIGDTSHLIAKVLPQNATQQSVIWTSSNPTIASVDTNGLVTAFKEGEISITATTLEGGYTAICEVKITERVGLYPAVKNKFAIYPTLTSGPINIVLNNELQPIQILNSSGRILQTIKLNSKEGIVDISSYVPGVYFVKHQEQVLKIVKR